MKIVSLKNKISNEVGFLVKSKKSTMPFFAPVIFFENEAEVDAYFQEYKYEFRDYEYGAIEVGDVDSDTIFQNHLRS